MLKVPNIIIEEYSILQHHALEQVRKTLNLNVPQFKKFIGMEGGQSTFDVVDNVLTNLIIEHITKNKNAPLKLSDQHASIVTNLHTPLLEHYFIFVATTHGIYENILAHLKKDGKQPILDVKDEINIIFYGNLCRLATEIGILLKNGYTDGALMLWRTFYEYSVVSVFLMQHNTNELALKFKLATVKEQKRQVESINKRHKDLKFRPIEDEVSRFFNQQYEDVKEKYEKGFFDNDYSWAKDYINGKPNFMALEEAADFGRLRPFYIWASGKTHPTYNGISSFRNDKGILGLGDITIPEFELQSMIDPAQLTLGVFYQVNQHFLYIYAEPNEYPSSTMVLGKLYDKFKETFKKNDPEPIKE